MLAARPTSMRASFIGLPASSAISRASSSSRDSIMLAASIRTAPRAAGSVSFQSGRALSAASMARSVSALSDLGVVPRISEGFEGFTISEVSPESAGTHSPPIKFKDSICDSIKIFLLNKTPVLSLPDPRPFYEPLRHLVLQHEISDGDPDQVPRLQREIVLGYYPRAGHQKGPAREGELPAQKSRKLLERALHLRHIYLALEDSSIPAPDAHGDAQAQHRLRSRDNDAWPKRARTVVDLGLREIQRVLALYVARGDVVAGGVADDLHPAVDDQNELGLGHVPTAVPANAYPVPRADDPPSRSLEKELGPLGVVDPLVSVGVRRLQLAGLPALQVGHPAGPDLVCRLDRRQEWIFGRPFGTQILQEASDARARHLEQPLQREVPR